MFDRFRRPRFSGSPDQVVWENFRDESVDAGRICSLQASNDLFATAAFNLAGFVPRLSCRCRNGLARTGASRCRPGVLGADATGHFKPSHPELPGGRQAIRILIWSLSKSML